MPKLPVVSGAEVVKVLTKAGWQFGRQRGDHVTLVKSGSIYIITVPMKREIKKGLLSDIIKEAGLSVDQFKQLLK